MIRSLLVASLTVLVSCRNGETTGPGRIDVAWTGADTGRLQVPASARWCLNDSLIEISGAAGDSGVALAMLPRDTTVHPGVFEVGMPLATVIRPGARVALRWPGETLTEGYYGLTGSVTVDSGPDLSGSLQATLRSVNDGEEITLSGTFREIRIRPGSPEACGMPVPPPSDESQEDSVP